MTWRTEESYTLPCRLADGSGLGEKLFAIPFQDLKFDHGKDETFFVLNVSKDKLKTAPGFDKHDWPNMADPNWAEQIDEYYRNVRTTTTTGATDSTK